VLWPVAVFALVFAIYNANGREITSWDSHPLRFTAIELAARGTLTLDRAVAALPVLKFLPGVAVDVDGRYRSAYPVLPAVLAAGMAKALETIGVLDLAAPDAGTLVAKLTASALTAFGVACAFVVVRRRLRPWPALFAAAGFGLGTNLWAVASQTLWQTETAVASLGGVALCLAVPADRLTGRRLGVAAMLLGIAGAARPQLAPAIAVMAVSIAGRRGRLKDLWTLVPLALITGAVLALNVRWFGHPLGAMPMLEARHATDHALAGTFANPLGGAAGLLVSPSRGLLIFSPVVAVVLAAGAALWRASWRDDLRWWACAATVQFAFYASYSVWWGGHTYGPRYCLDILPLLVPVAAAGLPWLLARGWRRAAAAGALAWSCLLAGTGAFVYPNDGWNITPVNVDQDHARLWDWRDPQFARCWRSAPSASNFRLWTTASYQVPAVAPDGAGGRRVGESR